MLCEVLRNGLLAVSAKLCDDVAMNTPIAATADLDVEVRDALNRRRGDWRVIAKDVDVSHSWISQFVRGKIPNPGYATLRRLHAHLCGQAAPAVAP